MRRGTRYPDRIDLGSVNATDLEISAEVSLGQALCDSILQHSFDDDDRRQGLSVFGTSYSRNRVRHAAFVAVSGLDVPEEKQFISISYFAPWERRPAAGLEPISTILSLLETYPEESELTCRVIFMYDNSRYDSAIRLPVALETPAGPEVDEIRGLRLTRTKDNLVVYSVVIDRPENEDTRHALSFTYQARFSSALPGRIVEEATEISREFVVERLAE